MRVSRTNLAWKTSSRLGCCGIVKGVWTVFPPSTPLAVLFATALNIDSAPEASHQASGEGAVNWKAGIPLWTTEKQLEQDRKTANVQRQATSTFLVWRQVQLSHLQVMISSLQKTQIYWVVLGICILYCFCSDNICFLPWNEICKTKRHLWRRVIKTHCYVLLISKHQVTFTLQTRKPK